MERIYEIASESFEQAKSLCSHLEKQGAYQTDVSYGSSKSFTVFFIIFVQFVSLQTANRLKIAKNNSVVAKLLASGHKMDSKVIFEFV